MTGRTHDLAAFTALSAIIAFSPPGPVRLSTVMVTLVATMIGGLAPDIDQPTAKLWRELPDGSFFGHLFAPLLGGHRYISHSIAGFVLFGIGAHYILQLMGRVVLVDMTTVWYGFLIGYASHLFMDTLTREGVPWLFPIPWKIGFPPLKLLRVKTGSIVETAVVFPLLVVITAYIYYLKYSVFLDILHRHVK